MAPEVRSGRMQQELPFGVRVRWERRRRSQQLRSMLLVSGVLLLGLLFYVWQHIQVVRLGYQIERLRAERVTLIQEGKALRLELGQLRSLKRVEEIARRELGMVNPVPGQIILVDEPQKGG
ncbi:MAG: septum formation initiator family protein [Candidatus Methylomirabilales bacterium]